MTNRERKMEEIRKEMYFVQMDIASDLERFGKKEAAAECRNEAFMGILRPEFWNNRVDMLFDINEA